jgi:peptide/nickel transport system substrate-binding protein
MRVSRRSTGLVLFAAVATFLAACGSSSSGGGTTATSTPAAAAGGAFQPAHQGGTLRLLAKAAAGTLDPKVNYTLEYWQPFQAVYDGLVAFKQVGGDPSFTVVPDLAESIPTPTDGGKTYVFTLRKGIKFSDGTQCGFVLTPVTP